MGADGTARGARLAEAWQANWSYLVGLAFGMLGDIGAAEDAVQEAFARLASTGPDQVEDARGWLIVVTSRICLDQIRSARSQRDRPYDATAIESAGVPAAPAPPVDPADRGNIKRGDIGREELDLRSRIGPDLNLASALTIRNSIYAVVVVLSGSSIGRVGVRRIEPEPASRATADDAVAFPILS